MAVAVLDRGERCGRKAGQVKLVVRTSRKKKGRDLATRDVVAMLRSLGVAWNNERVGSIEGDSTTEIACL